jgi:chromosome segregation ATPase
MGDYEGFNESLLERNLFKERSEKYRTETIALKSKLKEREEKIKAQKEQIKAQKNEYKKSISEIEFQRDDAILVINTLKKDFKESQIRYIELLGEYNELVALNRYIKSATETLNINYEKSKDESEKLKKDLENSRVVNSLLIGEIKKLNEQLNQ